jgi:hypothetical protein
LIEQMLESVHRVEYVARIRRRDISPSRKDPNTAFFDPLKAAILYQNAGDIDEAFWMVFLFVHFGKNIKTGWRLARDVYGALGGQPWVWTRVSADPAAFREWLASHLATLRGGDGVARHFGNHRKYVTLKDSGTGTAVETYVGWVGASRQHQTRIQQTLQECNGDPRRTFDALYCSMRTVRTFGRTARFDYLTMLGKLGLARIEPASTYMEGATGPLEGARLLFGDTQGRIARAQCDVLLRQLGESTGLGMQVIEDSLCNWQKNPTEFVPFRG